MIDREGTNVSTVTHVTYMVSGPGPLLTNARPDSASVLTVPAARPSSAHLNFPSLAHRGSTLGHYERSERKGDDIRADPPVTLVLARR